MNVGDLAETGVYITSAGLEELKQDLDDAAQATVDAGKKMANASKDNAKAFSDAFVVAQQKTIQAAKQMEAALLEQFERDRIAIKEGLARGFLTPAEAKQAGIGAAQAYNQGLLATLDQLAAAGKNSSNSAFFREMADNLKSVGDAGGAAAGGLNKAATAGAGGTLQLGRLRLELGTLLGRLTGTSTALDRMGGSLLALGGGNTIALAVLAGAVAIGYAYEQLTEKTRKAREEQEKLTTSLIKWYKAKNDGERLSQIDAAQKTIARNQDELDTLNKRLASPTFNRSEAVESAIRARITVVTKLLDEERAALAAGSADYQNTLTNSFVQEQNAEAAHLATLITQHKATDAEIKRAAEILKQDQALLQAYTNPPANATQETRRKFTEWRAAIADSVKGLEEAASGKKDIKSLVGVFVPFSDETVHAAQLELESMKKLADANAIAYLETQKSIAADTLAGVAKQKLVVQIDAQIARVRAAEQFRGADLDSRLKAIDADEKAAVTTLTAKQADETRTDAIKLLTETMKVEEVVAHRNSETTKKWVKDTNDANAEAEAFASTLQNDVVKALEHFNLSAVGTLPGLLNEMTKTSTRLLDVLDQHIAGVAKRLTDSTGKMHDQLQKELDALQKYKGVAEKVVVGVTAFSGGYDIGKGSGNTALGVLGGAASGAAVGNEILPGGWGAAIGGLAGAAGGLLGAARAQQEAADALRAAVETFRTNANVFIAQGTAGGSLAAQLAQIDVTAKALHDQASDLASHGGLSDTEYERTYEQITGSANAQKAQINFDFISGLGKQLNALGGTAGAYANQLDDINKQYLQNIQSARALGLEEQLSSEIEAIRAKAIDQLNKAQAEAATRTKEDLAVRASAAGGNDYATQQLQQQIAQRRELADAVASGADADTIALIQLVQAMETAAAAAERAQHVQDVNNDLAVRQLKAQGKDDAAATLELQIQQAKELAAAIKDGLDDGTIAALKMTQAMEAAALAAQQAADAQARLDALSVRQLKATGQDAAADALRFTLDQAKELQDAINHGYSAEYIDKLKEVLALEKSQHDAQALVASSAAQAAQNTAKAFAAQTNLTVRDAQALSESTGIRMVDELASIRAAVQSLDRKTGGYNAPNALTALTVSNTANAQAQAQGGGIVFNQYGDVYIADGTDPATAGVAFAGAVQQQLARTYKRDSVRKSPTRSMS